MRWAEAHDLASRHGGDFYVVDLARFHDNVTRFTRAFRNRYPRTQLAYPYKTNYTHALREAALVAGLWADVASAMEFDLAAATGLTGSEVLVNGPRKSSADLHRMIRAGAIVVVDSPASVNDVLAAADLRPKVLVRCRLDAQVGVSSRFGLDEAELPTALDALRAKVHVLGLTHHYAGDRSASGFAARTRRLLLLAREHFGPRGPEIIDVGGGYASPLPDSLRAQTGHAEADYDDYAEAVAAQVAREFPDGAPLLIAEPGTAVVADAVTYVCQVIDTRPPDLVVVAGSMISVKPTRHPYELAHRVLARSGASGSGQFRVVGDTCMEHDQLLAEVEGPMDVGDFLLIDNVGAYTMSMRPRFITGDPPVITWDGERYTCVSERVAASAILSQATRPWVESHGNR